MAIQKLLSELGKKLREDRPLVPPSYGHRIVVADQGRGFAQIWIRTRGCKHDVLQGGCAICNYWASTPPSTAELVTSIEAAGGELSFEPTTIVLSASGSFLDPWEVDPQARRCILKYLRKHFPKTHVILETHPDTINADSIAECLQILGPLTIEMGLESSSSHILRCCLNRPSNPIDFSRALKVIKDTPSVSTIANVVLGIPFLTADEIVNNAVATVNWAFAQGVDECVLFPINLKPYTIAHWLANHALYSQPNLWVLVEALALLPEEWLPRTNFAWHRVDRGQESIWDQGIIPPTSCDSCYRYLVTALDTYLASSDRGDIVQTLKSNICPCYMKWRQQNRDERPLRERLYEGYQIITTNTFGADYWNFHNTAVRNELDTLFATNIL